MRKMTGWTFSKTLLIFACFAALSGCGGSSSGTNNGVINLSGGASATAIEAVQISNASLALNAASVPVTATYLDLSGNPISGLQVTFSTNLGTLSPGSGIATTDASGLATVQLSAGANAGAGLVTATATVAGVKVSKAVAFTVALPAITISTPVLGLSSLAPGGSTSVTVNLTDASGAPFLTPVDVSFSSGFSSSGKATLITPVRSVNGTASSTYTATGGVGTDTITAFVGSNTSIPVTVTVAGAAARAISFVSASPQNISLKGMGGVGSSESSTVTFKILDINGQPKSGQTVDFSLNTTLGGIQLSSSSASSISDGTVSTIVTSGTFATPIRVTATIRGTLIATQSDLLVVSTGVPAQDSYSVALTNLNSGSFDHDGVQVGVTVRLSDHFHNPVPNGTAVYFTTTGGSITSSCLTTAGACTVQWTSQEPRPTNGRVVILTYAVGEEAFTDKNGSGFADFGEFTPDTVAFRDDNFDCTKPETGTIKDCVIAEQLPWLDFDSLTWSAGASHSFPDPNPGYIGILQGVNASNVPYAAFNTPHLKHIFRNVQFVMSTDAAKIFFTPKTVTVSPAITPPVTPIQVAPTTTDETITGPGSFSVLVTDLNGNTMASGTTITVTAPYGTLSGDTSVTVPQSVSGGQLLTLSLAAASPPVSKSADFIVVKVTSPSGLITNGYIPISGSF